MSVDRSLRIKAGLAGHRNVLSRAERIEKLKQQEKWKDEMGALGLPKVGNRKASAGKKAKKDAAAEGAAAPGAAPAAAPAAAAAKK
jgi:small basic protein (TIGR04137 family)